MTNESDFSDSIRPAAVAGSFYPADKYALEQLVAESFKHAKSAQQTLPQHLPKAIIVPHAGLVYSGAIAASAYQLFKSTGADINHIVLLGPSHRVPLRGMAIPASKAFATPLGNIRLNQDAIATLAADGLVQVNDLAHAYEHSLEVQLPFLQSIFADFSLTPIVVGETSIAQVAAVLEKLWGDSRTLIVISSDLSHFHDYQTARKIDSKTSQLIESLQAEKLDYEMACGCNPVTGLLDVARNKKLHPYILDLRNSGDTAGSYDRVVGYGAYAFFENHAQH